MVELGTHRQPWSMPLTVVGQVWEVVHPVEDSAHNLEQTELEVGDSTAQRPVLTEQLELEKGKGRIAGKNAN